MAKLPIVDFGNFNNHTENMFQMNVVYDAFRGKRYVFWSICGMSVLGLLVAANDALRVDGRNRQRTERPRMNA